MKVEWDPRKAAANQRKHGVDFADAAVALEDHYVRIISARNADRAEARQYFRGAGYE